MFTKLSQMLRQTAKALCLSLAAVALLNVVAVSSAIAMPTDSADMAISLAVAAVDDVIGEGTSNQIEGKVQRDLGKAERSIGKVTGQAEGAADQVTGKVKSDIGRTQEAAEDLGDTAEDAGEGLVDSIKDLFN